MKLHDSILCITLFAIAQKLIVAHTEWSKGRYTPVCVSKLPSTGLTIDYTVIVDLAPLTIAE